MHLESADLDTILDRLEGAFGNVATGEAVLMEFYTAFQQPEESVNSWGIRLEEILQKAIDKGHVKEEEKDYRLRHKFWRSLKSERLKNATRVHFYSIENFEKLRSAVRAEENEMKLNANPQCQPMRTQNKELIQILKRQEKEMQEKEEKIRRMEKEMDEKERWLDSQEKERTPYIEELHEKNRQLDIRMAELQKRQRKVDEREAKLNVKSSDQARNRVKKIEPSESERQFTISNQCDKRYNKGGAKIEKGTDNTVRHCQRLTNIGFYVRIQHTQVNDMC